MDKRMRTNLALLAAVAVLGLVIWLAPAPEDEQKGVALFDEGAEFSRIEVRDRDATRFVLERRDERWRLAEPYALDADKFQVDSLLDGLRQRAERRYPLAEANLAELGLEEPGWTLSVDGETLALGERAALGNNRYVRKGDHVYLVSDVLSYRLQREPLDYASKRLLPADTEIAAIELPAGERIERAESGWHLVPENDAVSADAVQALANAWRHATAMRVRAADAPPEGDAAMIELANGDRLRFIAVVNEDGLTLTRDEPLLRYELMRDDARRLLQLEVASASTQAGEQADEGGEDEN